MTPKSWFVLIAAVGFAAAPAFADSISPQQRVILAQGAQTMCPQVVIPVCAMKDGKPVAYNNDCEARRDGATDVKPGRCTGASSSSGY